MRRLKINFLMLVAFFASMLLFHVSTVNAATFAHVSQEERTLNTVYVYTEKTGEPVVGAHVFEVETNELLGVTGEDGFADFVASPDTLIRVVEPNYGEQQYMGPASGGCTVIAWTSDGKPVYSGDCPKRVASIYVYTAKTGEPVGGAHVFADETNELLGVTGEDGFADFMVTPATVIRVVEPNYGEQQYVGQTLGGCKVVAWGIDGKPIYDGNCPKR